MNPNKMPQDYFFEYVLSQRYDVVYEDRNPDVVIYSVFGPPPRRDEYSNDPVLIGYTGEPYEVQGEADLFFGFSVEPRPNYFRLPLWALYIMWDLPKLNAPYKLVSVSGVGQGSHHIPTSQEQIPDDPLKNPLLVSNILVRHKNNGPKSKFCNFTYNNAVQSRVEFFTRLGEYKMVESTGGLLNNTNYRMVSKTKELADYKFTIAFENTISSGYVTEKIAEPLIAGSVPIYYGGDFATEDFNKEAFINVRDFGSFADAIAYIKAVDNDERLYDKYLSEPIFNKLVPYPELVLDRIYNKLIEKNEEFILGPQ